MATFHRYKCSNPNCDFEIHTEPYGHYALMSGEYYEFRCPKCREIKEFCADKIAKVGYAMDCPACRSVLYSWNATDCKCPKCNSALKDTGEIMMAD